MMALFGIIGIGRSLKFQPRFRLRLCVFLFRPVRSSSLGVGFLMGLIAQSKA